jgi:Tetratricopeptide repeat
VRSLNNLAAVLRGQGDVAAARQLHERALAISEKLHGSEHPNTAKFLNNLAATTAAAPEPGASTSAKASAEWIRHDRSRRVSMWFILPSCQLMSSSPALTSWMALALAVTWI